MKQYKYETAPKTQKDKVQYMYIESRLFDVPGELPDALFEYTNIEKLGIRGTLTYIPEEIKKLKKLRELSIAFLGANGLTEVVGELKNLEELSIAVTDGPLTIPDSLAKLDKLKIVNFRECHLKAIPAVLKKLPNLIKIELVGNQITGTNLDNKCYWPQLEVLSLNRNALEKVPAWVYQHKKLKRLLLTGNQLQNIGKELLELPELVNLQLDNNQLTALPKEILQLQELKYFNWFDNPLGWINPLVFELQEQHLNFQNFWRRTSKQAVKDILSIRKALNKAGLTTDRIVIQSICILLNDRTEQIAQLSNQAILACYHVNNTKIRKAVVSEIINRLQPFDNKEFISGRELLVLGTTIEKKTTLKTRLKDLGIKVVNKVSQNTSHVLLGKNMKQLIALENNQLIVLNETELNHYLDQAAPAYLVEAEKEGPTTNVENLCSMLLSMADDNVKIALELLKSGGVPKDLMTILFFVHKFSTNASIVRKTKNLLTLNASEKLLAVLKIRFNLKQERWVSFFETRNYLDKVCADTELDKKLFLEYAMSLDKYDYTSLYTDTLSQLPEKEQKEAAEVYWNSRVEDGKLVFKDGDGRIIKHLFEMDIVEELEGHHYYATMLTSDHGAAKMKRLKKLTLLYTLKHKVGLPTNFGTIDNLEELNLTNILFHEQSWEEYKRFKNVKKLSYTSEARQIPAELFELKSLKKLVLKGKDLELNFPIHQLQNLEELHIPESSLINGTVLFENIKQLPHLKVIKFHKALNKLYKAT